MSESIQQLDSQPDPQRSPLHATYERLGATLREQHGWIIPAHYGDAAAEYNIVRRGVNNSRAGLIDLSMRGRLEVSGSEAVQFLNGMVTNDVKTLADDSWMPAAFPNVQGRLLAQTRFLRCGNAFLIDTEAASHQTLAKTLERFTYAGDFHMTDLTARTALISVQGAHAAEVVRKTFDESTSTVAHGRIIQAIFDNTTVDVARATHTGENGFDLFINHEQAPALWDALMAAGAHPVGSDALEILRVEAGLPSYKVDIDESVNVLEAALDDAISYTKGCYVSQEILARIHWRGHVARRLCGLSFEGNRAIAPNAKVKALDGKEIGRVTSIVLSPMLNRTIALGYVKYNYLPVNTQVRVVTEDNAEHPAHIAELPFVRGSWFETSTVVDSSAAESTV